MRRIPFFFSLFVLAACGGSSSIDTTDQDSGEDVSLDSGGSDVRFDAPSDTRPTTDSGTKDSIGADTADTAPDDSSTSDTSTTDTSTTDTSTTDSGVDTTPDVIFVDVIADVIVDVPFFDAGSCGAGSSCGTPLACCSGKCVYEQNDPHNCGGCGVECTGSTSMCEGGHCVAPSCSPPCGTGSICCDVPGPGPTRPPACYAGDSCPIGCPLCL